MILTVVLLPNPWSDFPSRWTLLHKDAILQTSWSKSIFLHVKAPTCILEKPERTAQALEECTFLQKPPCCPRPAAAMGVSLRVPLVFPVHTKNAAHLNSGGPFSLHVQPLCLDLISEK